MKNKYRGFYCRFVKRFFDIVLSALALVLLFWLYGIIAVLVRIKLGAPVIYTQARNGKDEKEFNIYKFRSMTNACDASGKPLPDTQRLTRFGRFLRSTSMDELPSVWNILKGDLSIIGPRPLPTVYLPYYKDEERPRHYIRPGLTGLAQVNGRNAISWDEKFKYDVQYVNNVSFLLDVKIFFKTIKKVLCRSDIGQGEKRPVSLNIERAYMTENIYSK